MESVFGVICWASSSTRTHLVRTANAFVPPSLVIYVRIYGKTQQFCNKDNINSSHLFPCINSYCIRGRLCFAFNRSHSFRYIRICLSFFSRSHIKCEGLFRIGGCVRIWNIHRYSHTRVNNLVDFQFSVQNSKSTWQHSLFLSVQCSAFIQFKHFFSFDFSTMTKWNTHIQHESITNAFAPNSCEWDAYKFYHLTLISMDEKCSVEL